MSPNENWWNLGVEEVCGKLETHLSSGLSQDEARQRFEKTGPNQLPEAKGISPFKLFLSQFNNLIVWILIVAALIAGFLGEWIDTAAIFAIIILNSVLGFVQEFRAEKSLQALRRLASPTCKVIREGLLQSLPASAIVPGDLILLEAGERVPTDGRIIQFIQLRAQESALTGESEPVNKTSDRLAGEKIPIGDRRNMVFMGTVVTSGKGHMLVTETGLQTELGKIAALLKEERRAKTPLEIRLEQLGRKLVVIFIAVVIVVFALGLFCGNEFVEMLLTALSLAVAAIPEGLPAVVTITLALGVRKMARRNALIRRLSSVETLGCAAVICVDKTGTLTEDQMTVRRIWVSGETLEVTGTGYAPQGEFRKAESALDPSGVAHLPLALQIGVLCNNANLYSKEGQWQIAGDPTEGALLTAAAKAGLDKARLDSENALLYEIPFDSERKRMSMLRETPEGRKLFVKGGVDILLKRSEWALMKGEKIPLSEKLKVEIEAANQNFASQALRVIAVCFRDVSVDEPLEESLEKNLVFAGLLAMMDPPRPEAKKSIAVCREAGIRTVMITGDHKETAMAVARELGLFEAGATEALSGAELDEMTDEALKDRIGKISVYARVSAEHKLRIVKAWKAKGEVVAMTGDGVNDAPAIKEANIGIAMGRTGTDVTKEASDMVITDDNFASIVNAVEEGRGVYDNIVKFIKFLLSYNLAEILVILASILIGLKDPEGNAFIPLTAVQLLWMNLVTDGFPAIALGIDPLAPDAMSRRPRRLSESIFTRGFVVHMGIISIIVAAGSLAACWIGLRENAHLAHTMTLTTLVMLELMGVQMVRSIYHISFFSNRWLLVALGVSWLLQLFIIYTPGVQQIFKLVPLGISDWGVILSIGLVVGATTWLINKGFGRFFRSA